MVRFKTFILAVLLIAAFSGCKKDPDDNQDSEEFDRTALLENLADNYIVPAYQDFESRVLDLDSSVATFVATPNVLNLTNLRTAWVEALTTWQAVSYVNIGYGASISQRSQFNIYPIDTAQIHSNISSGPGTYNLGTPANLAAKGFQAFDYLLYGIGATDAEIVDQYIVDAEATSRKNYLSDLATDMKTYAQAIANDWTGGYRDTFVANSSDNSAGSSMSLFVNAFIQHYESYVRKGKLGLPSGEFNVFTGTPLPDHVECYYYGQSLPFLETALTRAQDYFNGTSYDGTSEGTGLDDYLVFLESQLDGQPMEVVINNQFAAAISEIQNLADPLSDEVSTNPTGCSEAYVELQKIVAYFKTDMVSELGIQISYADTDGD